MTINEFFLTIRDWAVGKFQPKGSYAASSDIPTKVSELENDKRYLVQETDPTVPEWAKQPVRPTYNKADVGLGNADNTSDISKPVSTAQQAAIDAAYQQSTGYTDQKIAGLINGAPGTLDTLGKIAEAMQDNQDVVTALEQAIGTKANEADLNGHISNSTIHTSASEKTAWNNKMEKTGDASNTTVAFTQATTRANIASGEKMSVIMGKIRKVFADLKTVAFTGKYTDLTDTPSIPTASATTPKANGTAAVGTEAAFARGDHVHPLQKSVTGSSGSCTGNAATATRLATARTISLTGAITGSANFNGSANVSIDTTATVMEGATSTSSGSSGAVPAPAAGAQGNFLRADGTWVSPYPIKIEYYTGNTTTTNLMVSLNSPCLCITSTENITDKPSGKYGTIVIFKFSNSRIGAICICTDGSVYHNAWNASTESVAGWK